MVEKNRRRGTNSRVTEAGSGRTTPSGTPPKKSQHKPIVRFIAALAIAMLILSLATGIIAIVTG